MHGKQACYLNDKSNAKVPETKFCINVNCMNNIQKHVPVCITVHELPSITRINLRPGEKTPRYFSSLNTSSIFYLNILSNLHSRK